ncbi:hypothetical protein LP420_23520 [Massilia sp. B-10]|nr:hypothetical protein LP420_23520 [Massilia sp. B-10]
MLPLWLTQSQAQQQALVMAHESSHMAARDPQLLGLALLVLVAMPWNLPMWWQLRRLRHAIEVDCDARVLACLPRSAAVWRGPDRRRRPSFGADRRCGRDGAIAFLPRTARPDSAAGAGALAQAGWRGAGRNGPVHGGRGRPAGPARSGAPPAGEAGAKPCWPSTQAPTRPMNSRRW